MARLTSPLPELFVIKASSPKPHKPEDEKYFVRTRLTDGHWEPTPRGLNGMGEVKWFLRSNRVDGTSINSAIEEFEVAAPLGGPPVFFDSSCPTSQQHTFSNNPPTP